MTEGIPAEFYMLPPRVQENMIFEARCMAKSLRELMDAKVHEIWISLAGDKLNEPLR